MSLEQLLVEGGAFPYNVVQVITTEYTSEKYPDVEIVVERPLTTLDASFSIGIVALTWVPGAHERAGQDNLLGQIEPTLATYHYAIQSLVRHTDPIEGLATAALLAKQVRTMLVRDPQVRLRLAALSETSLGATERLQRWGVGTQRYASNELEGEWLYLATTELWVETETVPN